MSKTREQMIEWLIDNDLGYVTQTSGGLEWLKAVLERGFHGYDNQANAELKAEILERDPEAFDEEAADA